MKKVLLTTSASLMLSACSISPELYNDNNPSLSFSNYFNGKLCAWGTVKDRSRQLTRKFIANIDAFKDDSKIVLDEQFIFSDGEKQTRVWKFTENANGLTGTAGDVVGNAKGKIYGDSLHLNYTLDIPHGDDSIEVNMDDWLHLVDRNTLMGSTKMTKWGIDVGQIDIVIKKRSAATECFSADLAFGEKSLTGEINAEI